MTAKDIFSFVTQEETAYGLPIEVIEGYEWSMKNHIRLSKLYKNSQFSVGNSEEERDDKPFMNIVRPVLNLQYRAEGFDVKDIALYITEQKSFFKSFLLRKYHDKWANENEIDTFIDTMVESYVDYGGALIKDVNDKKPEVVLLETIAFCDQTNMLGGPLAIKHFYAPDELEDFAALGWGDPKNGADVTIEEAIILAKQLKVPDKQDGVPVKTPGKYVEVYEVHGMLPASWLSAEGGEDTYIRQMQIILFYTDNDGKKQGLKLFAKKRKKSIFKQILRDKVHGRALGFGGVEELFDAQVWTNYDQIIIKGLLDQAAKVLYITNDQTFNQKNKTEDAVNGQTLVVDDGKQVTQLNTSPVNISLFERSLTEWNQHAKDIASATGATTGISPGARVSFNALSLLTQQGLALHDYRKGKLATFTATIWREWVIPKLAEDISQGATFLQELSLDELQQVIDSIVENAANDIIKKKILAGEAIIPSDIDNATAQLRARMLKGGTKQFLEIFKGEMKNLPMDVSINIADKQKDLGKLTDFVLKMFQDVIAAPQILNDPRMVKIFNQILEMSGISPIDFGTNSLPPQQPAQPVPSKVVPTPPVAAA